MVDWKKPFKKIQIGQGRKIKDGSDVAILTIGAIGKEAIKACEELDKQGINAAHYDLRFVKPLDELLLDEVFTKFDKVITVEDAALMGGMGSAVVEFMIDKGYSAQVKRLGIPDKYIEHGSQAELYAECFYDAAAITKTAKELSGSVVKKVVS